MASSRFRFSTEADISLLRETVAVNPYSRAIRNSQAWALVASNLSNLDGYPDNISTRTVRERLGLLIEKYRKEIRENETSSESVEDRGEKHTLLEEICRLQEGVQLQRREQAVVGRPPSNTNCNTDIAPDFKIKSQPTAMEALAVPTTATSEPQAFSILSDEEDSDTGFMPGLGPGHSRKRRAGDDGLLQFMKMKEERRWKEIELQEQKEELERQERQEDREWQREKDRLDREERRMEQERQREREELDRDERKMERVRQHEREELDREERRKERERQQEREEREFQRQKDKEQHDREERKLMLQMLMKALKQ